MLLVWLRLPAFVGLVIAAMAIGIVTPEVAFAEVPAEIAESFGDVMVSIGIPILMAAIIGKSLMDSGAADRIVRGFLSVTGNDRLEYALMAIGFGGMIAPWYNDSGFWIVSEVADITQLETVKSYSAVCTVMSVSGLVLVYLVQLAIPLA